MNTEQLRAEFENWARWYALPVTRLVNDDRYESLETEAAYKAWQAGRAALQSQDREEVELSNIGRAIYRACSDLPDGYEIRIDLEKGSGIVYVTDRDGDETMIDSGGELFSYQINAAIDHARRIEGEGE